MELLQTAKEYFDDFVNLIFPRVCVNCDTILVYQEEHLCMGCRLSLPKTNYHERKENFLEQKFIYEPKVKAAACYLYFNKGGVAQKLVHEMKYNAQPEIGVALGRWYANDLIKAEWSIDMIIPVPLHRSKLQKRGFNQSEMFARGLGEMLDLEVKTDIVRRIRKTSTQTRKSKVQRWQNMESVYEVAQPEELTDKNILIVDDVLTTGATIGECIAKICEYPVGKIYVATIAAGK